jgi:hypothetical protein
MNDVSRWNRFEELVLRVCRKVYLLLAALGASGIVLGLLAATVGLVMPMPPEPPPPAEVEPLRAPTLQDAERILDSRPELANTERLFGDLSIDARTVRKVKVPEGLRSLFPDSVQPWDDVTEEYCRVNSGYGCLEKGRRISRPGVSRVFHAAFGDAPEAEAAPVLEGVARVLRSAPAERRLMLIVPAAIAHMTAKAEHQKKVEEREKEVGAAAEKAEQARSERKELKVGLGVGGLYVAGTGFSTAVLAGLFLAFLAIERHLRALRGGWPR